MTNITKAAQDALAALDEIHAGKRHPQLALAVAQQLRAALQDKAGEVRGYEPAGFLLHWPAPGGGRDILWSRDGAAGHAIGCPVTEIFKATDRAAQPAPVVPDDVARDAEWFRLIRNGSGWPAVFAAHDAPEPLRGDDLDAAMIAASRQKQTIFEPCCDKEDRTLSGGCRNCGDPCL